MPAAVLALLLSLVAIGGSLYLSLGLGLQACPLCFYQRTFAFTLVGLLAVGLALPGRNPRALCVLALMPAVGGLGVAGFHAYLATSGKLECPLGVADLGVAPLQSFVIFALVTLTLLTGAVSGVKADGKLFPAAALAVLLGLAAAYGSMVANPPAKKADKPLEDVKQLKTCQVPYTP